MANSEVEITPEVEEALERLFNDAKVAADNGRTQPTYNGRYATDVEDDITFVRAELDIEL